MDGVAVIASQRHGLGLCCLSGVFRAGAGGSATAAVAGRRGAWHGEWPRCGEAVQGGWNVGLRGCAVCRCLRRWSTCRHRSTRRRRARVRPDGKTLRQSHMRCCRCPPLPGLPRRRRPAMKCRHPFSRLRHRRRRRQTTRRATCRRRHRPQGHLLRRQQPRRLTAPRKRPLRTPHPRLIPQPRPRRRWQTMPARLQLAHACSPPLRPLPSRCSLCEQSRIEAVLLLQLHSGGSHRERRGASCGHAHAAQNNAAKLPEAFRTTGKI